MSRRAAWSSTGAVADRRAGKASFGHRPVVIAQRTNAVVWAWVFGRVVNHSSRSPCAQVRRSPPLSCSQASRSAATRKLWVAAGTCRCVGMGVRSCGEPLVKVPLRTSEEIATSLVQPGEQVSGDTQVVGGRRDLPVTQWRMIGLREEASAQMPGGELIEQPEVLCCRRYLGEMLADPSEIGRA